MKKADPNKIAIIVARKNDSDFVELLESLQQLIIPDDFYVDILPITNYSTRVAACAYAMEQSDAKYKVYVREDCKILRKDLLKEIIETFQKNGSIGMVGNSGTRVIPTHLDCTKAKKRAGMVELADDTVIDWGGSAESVMAVDDYFIATQYDLPWDVDLLSNDYYGFLAQCRMFIENEYSISVLGTNNIKLEKNIVSMVDEDAKSVFRKKYANKLFPLVTVLLQTHNRPHLFKRALESVLNQTYTNIEIVISDNSDDDDTEKIAQEYVLMDGRIKYFHNKGLDMSENSWFLCEYDNPNSEYVNWLFDDDGFYPEKIEKELNYYLEEDGVSLVTSYRKRIDENGNVLEDNTFTAPVTKKTSRIDGRSAARYLILNKVNYIGEPSTVLIKKSLVKLDGIIEDKFYEKKWKYLYFSWKDGDNIPANRGDYQTWLWLLEKGDMIYLTEPLCWFGVHSGQLQTSNVESIRQELVNWAWITVLAFKKGLIEEHEKISAIVGWLKMWLWYAENLQGSNNVMWKKELYQISVEFIGWFYMDIIPKMDYLLNKKRS